MLSKMLRAVVGNQAPPAPATDPNFNQVALLLHGDGTNGAQNNTFLDSSTNNLTITRGGTTTQGTFTPFSQENGYWSNNFNGTNSYLTVPRASVGVLSGNQFTIETFVYLNRYATPSSGFYTVELFSSHTTGTNPGFEFQIQGTVSSYTSVGLYANNGAISITFPFTFSLGTWYHVAVTRTSAGVFVVYVNGTSIGTTTNTATWTDNTTYSIARSLLSAYSYYLPGYLSNYRIVIGSVVYTNNFTAPTTPLTAVTNTKLLTCQLNRFVDNSSSNVDITAINSPSVQPFSPFAPTSEYSTNVNGGSLRFNGTTDYLLQTSGTIGNFGTGNFTVEFWVYPLATPTSNMVDFRGTPGSSTTSLRIAFASTNPNKIVVGFSNADNQLVSTSNILTNTWTHVAVVRSGTNATIYINGVAESTITNSTNLTDAGLVIGSYRGTSFYFNGYLSSLRVVKGSAVYTANFTPPTAPLTAITNTSLLLSGTNAGIFDNSIKSNLDTRGVSKIDTSIVKYGTGSISFNGTTGYLNFPNSVFYAFGPETWTIESWVYTNSVTTTQTIIDTRSTNSALLGVRIGLNSTGFPFVTINNATLITSSSALTIGTWTHVALVKNGTTVTLYLNGISTGSATSTTTLTDQFLRIGANAGTAATFFNGYLDEVRITRGIARYTANFTPPTQAFPNQ